MFLREILKVKGSNVHTVGPDASLDDVVTELVRYNVGALVVCEPAPEGSPRKMIGIISERDILRAHAALKGLLNQRRVSESMTQKVISASPDDRLEDAMHLMTENRVRHLPITKGGELLGMISIGDVVKAHRDQLETENFYMKSYIQGEGAAAATPL